MTLGEIITQYPSALLTASIALAFLWLALYVFRVNPDDSVSKLAASAMFTVFLYLFSHFLVGAATSRMQVLIYQKTLWWLPFAPVLWLHLSQKATRPPLTQTKDKTTSRINPRVLLNSVRSPSVLGFFYGIALVFKIIELFTNGIFQIDFVNYIQLPMKNEIIPTGPNYPLFALFTLLTVTLACINFIFEWRQSQKSEYLWLSLGSICFWIASVGLAAKTFMGLDTGFAYGNSVLAIGIFVVAIAILKHNALLKKEELERDVIYTTLGAIGISAVYAVTLIIGQGSVTKVPAITIAFIAALALCTHILADNIKIWFSKTIGTRIGLFTDRDVNKMKELYYQASKMKRHPSPVVELFKDDGSSIDQLASLLTPRQKEIITLRAKGLSDKQIASTLDIKLPTVRKHIEDIKNRLGSRDKADCAVYCIVTGLIGKDDLINWFDSLNLDKNHS
ncbi:MAG: hypothetical protein HY779_03315 [Rubrobacteridae bacterium]|nr:hypothetical protein [Rubrobacteridae bacterium]